MIRILLIALSFFQSVVSAQSHEHHVKHNMALYGNESGLYLSHLVYKSPHNYQVILKVNLPPKYAKLYERLENHPDDLFLMILNPMEISRIQEKPVLTGPVVRTEKSGTRETIYERVLLQPEDYSIIYFAELPLNLSGKSTQP